MLYLVLIILILVVSIRSLKNRIGHTGIYGRMSSGNKKEDSKTLFSRIDYVNNIDGKLPSGIWIIIQSIILCFFISLFVFNGFPKGNIFLGMICICVTILLATEKYYEHHIKKFIYYFNDRNIRILMKRYKIDRVEIQPNNTDKDKQSDYYEYH